MSKRSGKSRIDKRRMVCAPCLKGDCDNCVDVIHAALRMPEICTCTRKGHGGEPALNQIKDPVTGDVYTPGLVVRENGEVERL